MSYHTASGTYEHERIQQRVISTCYCGTTAVSHLHVECGLLHEQVPQRVHSTAQQNAIHVTMRDSTNSNLVTAIKGFRIFDGRKQWDFRYLHKNMAVILGVTRRDIADLVNGHPQTTEATVVPGFSPQLFLEHKQRTGSTCTINPKRQTKIYARSSSY